MNLNKFKYQLTEENIASFPPAIRGNTKMLIVNTKDFYFDRPASDYCEIDTYGNISKYIPENSMVVLNDTKVLPTRIRCVNHKNKEIEIMFLENHNNIDFLEKAIVKGKVKVGHLLKSVEDPTIIFEVVNKDDKFISAKVKNNKNILEVLGKIGNPPIPPYLNRVETEIDFNRYQTIFAEKEGSVAAPTASLNMTNKILASIKSKNVAINYITLHCGYGTFKPIIQENIKNHDIHEEYFECPLEVYQQIKQFKNNHNSIIAVGTTVTRTLEYLFDKDYISEANSGKLTGETNLYLYPGKKFKIVDYLLTNFHAPNSTPILLSSAFFIQKIFPNLKNKEIDIGIEKFLELYNFALKNNFKFLSYGDSMLIT